MNIRVLASDYDGTLADEGEVTSPTVAALRRARAGGLVLIMVTGRELPDLRRVFAHLDLFDAVVAENGALLWRPGWPQARLLSPPSPAALVVALRARGVAPINVGEGIVATDVAHAPDVISALAETGVGWQAILNKNSVMCLAPGVDKGSGLRAALAELGLSASEAVGVGDAENDAALFAACGRSAAVANALPGVKAAADLVTEGAAGAGVAWLIDRILAGALAPARGPAA